ncbi:MAG: hypothetical protein QOF78_2348 [Phycisphaerales bacterium]|nr:hypothetical protein [Phycisphaerales bacterium]
MDLKSLFRAVRARVKRLPLIGRPLYHLYLLAFCREGRVCVIEHGHLRGTKLRRFNRTLRVQTTYLDGTYEGHLQDALVRELKPGQVFWDVGANEGFFTLLAAKLVGDTGTIVAFEAHPDTCNQLRQQVAVNDLRNVTIVQKAVADRSGKMSFVDDAASTMARLAEARNTRAAGRMITVDATTLDDSVNCAGKKPTLLKIDVEGAEILVLRGADRLLRECRPTILVELHDAELAAEARAIFDSYGYSLSDSNGRVIPHDQYVRLVCARPAATDANSVMSSANVTDDVRAATSDQAAPL